MNILDKMKIQFDENGHTSISKEELLLLIKQVKSSHLISEQTRLSAGWYVSVDRNLTDFYFFPAEEFEEWEKDGRFEKGDSLYKMSFVKTF